jgi:hypothetical protein
MCTETAGLVCVVCKAEPQAQVLLVILLRVWYVMVYEVLAAVVMVCSVGTVVATTTGRNEEATQN